MTTTQQRILMFMLICLPCRILLAYVAKTSDQNVIKALGYTALLPAIVFMYLFVTNTRKTGILGQKTWWHTLRPIHSLLFFTFSMMAISESKYAYTPLVIDAMLGFVSFMVRHFFMS